MNPVWILVLVMPVIGGLAMLALMDIARSLQNIETVLNEELDHQDENTQRHPGCMYKLSSSRICELGTKGCDVRHEKP